MTRYLRGHFEGFSRVSELVNPVGVFLPVPVPVQVTQRLPVGVFDLGGVVHRGADELKHRLPHICRDRKYRFIKTGNTALLVSQHFLLSSQN